MATAAWWGAFILGLASCVPIPAASVPTRGPSDPIAAKGFTPTAEGRVEVSAAIGYANRLLVETSVRFRPSWVVAETDAHAVPVHLVAAPPDAIATAVAVPRGCRCVFVNPVLLRAWLRRHTEGTGRLDVDLGYVLAFMLLHEAGHLTTGHGGVDFVDGGLAQLNADPTFEKQDEEAADDFAVALVRDYQRRHEPFPAVTTSNWISIALTNLSWNMQAYRTLDEFAATATGKRAVFFDVSYTHPNLAWRILRSNARIQDTPETWALLAAFEEARGRARSPTPLFSLDPANR